jgi:hypothetical protein
MRDSNIMETKDGFRLFDFDWAGTENEARYPCTTRSPNLLCVNCLFVADSLNLRRVDDKFHPDVSPGIFIIFFLLRSFSF